MIVQSSDRGFTLIEALIGLVIVTIVGAAFTTLMSSMSMENRSVSDAVERSDLERQFGVLLSDDRLCGCNLFNSPALSADPSPPLGLANSQQVPLPQLFTSWTNVQTCAGPSNPFATPGQKMAALSPSFKVSQVSVRDLQPTGRRDPTTNAFNEYSGAVYINFDPHATPSRPVRAIKASKIFVTDPAGQHLISCSSASNFYADQNFVTNAPGAGSYAASIARCPPGYTIRSGGWKTDGNPPTCPSAADPRPPLILENHPVTLTGGVQGWKVVGSCVTLQAIAVCQQGR